MPQVTVDDLRKVSRLSDFADETLQWIIDHSKIQTFKVDEVLFKTGDPVDEMWIPLSGSFDFYWDTNGQLSYIRTWKVGDISGLLPYSRMKTSPGYSISTSQGHALMLHKRHFAEMERRFPDLVKCFVELLTDRVREFTASHQQQEKMSALGRMSAGLAHELNNPAAAIQRTSSELSNRMLKEIDYVLRLLETLPEKDRITEILLILKEKAAQSLFSTLSPLDKAQLEEELLDELDVLDIHEGMRIAETFAEIGISTAELKSVLNGLDAATIRQLMPWAENVVSAERLVLEIQKASSRISQLVNSIKSYAHMDRTYDMQPTDIHDGLDTTLVLLNHKMKVKNIQIVKRYASDIPHVHAFPGELNQIWTNIIDNAIDAMESGGKLTIETAVERNMVRVSVRDTGKGIPQDIRNKIFDPFFTTKGVGKGIGLGLDMVKRIVTHHQGEIKVISEPGNTEFVTCLPALSKALQHEQSVSGIIS